MAWTKAMREEAMNFSKMACVATMSPTYGVVRAVHLLADKLEHLPWADYEEALEDMRFAISLYDDAWASEADEDGW